MSASAQSVLVVLVAVSFLPDARAWADGEIPLNLTQDHIERTAVSDGELGTARSGVTFDRRPAYINGKDETHNEKPEVNGVRKKQDVNHDVMETQHTTCEITTEQLVATAQATVTRVMKGLCTSSEMDERISELEGLLTDRLKELKDVVLNLESRVEDYNEALRRGRYQQMETISKNCEPSKSNGRSTLSDGTRLGLKNPESSGHPAENLDNETEDSGPREAEMMKYNSSIYMEAVHYGPPKKAFSYYWKIRQMRSKLTDMDPRRSIRSPSFYIYPGGYRLYLRSYPRQNETNIYLHVGITKGEFDESLKWPFPLKLRVNILDQTANTRMYEDIASRTWDPSVLCSEFNWQKPTKGDNYECVGLGLPHDLLNHRRYIFADTLVVKLTVYLDS